MGALFEDRGALEAGQLPKRRQIADPKSVDSAASTCIAEEARRAAVGVRGDQLVAKVGADPAGPDRLALPPRACARHGAGQDRS
ncbi:hypothetical protein [Kitasatospora nipponensis]|uniref:hypothetical protein n=1 Tax=Kitasatospora nipponensis TaxID=258049 RepID=UPI0031DBAB2C